MLLGVIRKGNMRNLFGGGLAMGLRAHCAMVYSMTL